MLYEIPGSQLDKPPGVLYLVATGARLKKNYNYLFDAGLQRP